MGGEVEGVAEKDAIAVVGNLLAGHVVGDAGEVEVDGEDAILVTVGVNDLLRKGDAHAAGGEVFVGFHEVPQHLFVAAPGRQHRFHLLGGVGEGELGLREAARDRGLDGIHRLLAQRLHLPAHNVDGIQRTDQDHGEEGQHHKENLLVI